MSSTSRVNFGYIINTYNIFCFQKKAQAKKQRLASPEVHDPSVCFYCKQKLEDNPNLVFFENPPEGAKDEFEALFDESLKTDMFGACGKNKP